MKKSRYRFLAVAFAGASIALCASFLDAPSIPDTGLAESIRAARENPDLAVPGTDPGELRAAVRRLGAAIQELASVQPNSASALAVRHLYPLRFLQALADVEEARITFLSEGTRGALMRYELAERTAVRAGISDAAQFRKALLSVVPTEEKTIATAGGIFTSTDILKEAEDIEVNFRVLSEKIDTRHLCVRGKTTECTDHIVYEEYAPAPPPTDKARELWSVFADASYDEGSETVFVSMPQSACTGLLEGPHVFAISEGPNTPARIRYLSHPLFQDTREETAPMLRYLSDSRGIRFVPINPLKYYACPEVQIDAGTLHAARAGIAYARTRSGTRENAGNVLSADTVDLRALQKYLLNLKKNGSPNESSDASALLLAIQMRTAKLDLLVDEIARTLATDVAYARDGVAFNLEAKDMFLSHSAFPSLFLAHRLPDKPALKKDLSAASAGTYRHRFVSLDALLIAIPREETVRGIRAFFAFEQRLPIHEPDIEDTCTDGTRLTCVKDAVMKTIQTDGLTEGLAEVRMWHEKYPSFRPGCISLVRMIGDDTASILPYYGLLDMTRDIAVCDYQFLHGYMESAFRGPYAPALAAEFCRFADASLTPIVPDISVECFRNYGRTVAFMDPSLLGDIYGMITYSIRACDTYTQNDRERSYCTQGAFAAIGRGISLGAHGLSKDIDRIGVCASVPEDLRRECRGNMVKGTIVTIFAGSSLSIGEMLAKARSIFPVSQDEVPEILWVAAYEKGRQSVPKGDIETGVSQCSALSRDMQASCTGGFALGLAKHGTPWRQSDAVLDFCIAVRDAGMPASRCLAQALIYFRGLYDPNLYGAVCSDIQRIFHLTCEDSIQSVTQYQNST